MRALLKLGRRDPLIPCKDGQSIFSHSNRVTPRRSSPATMISFPHCYLTPEDSLSTHHEFSLSQTNHLYVLPTSSYHRKSFEVFCLVFFFSEGEGSSWMASPLAQPMAGVPPVHPLPPAGTGLSSNLSTKHLFSCKEIFQPHFKPPHKVVTRAWAPRVSLGNTQIPPTSVHPLQGEVSPPGTFPISRTHNPWQRPAPAHITKKCKKCSQK